MKLIMVTFLGLLLYTVAIPSCGRRIDKVCVKGKVIEYDVVPTHGNPGVVIAEPGDRIIARKCSEFMRKYTFRDEFDAIRDYITN